MSLRFAPKEASPRHCWHSHKPFDDVQNDTVRIPIPVDARNVAAQVRTLRNHDIMRLGHAESAINMVPARVKLFMLLPCSCLL